MDRQMDIIDPCAIDRQDDRHACATATVYLVHADTEAALSLERADNHARHTVFDRDRQTDRPTD